MRNTRLLTAMILGCAVSTAIYRVQDASTHREPPPPNFSKLFPRPTGQNGYEEFVMAVDLLNASPACQEYEKADDEPTLTMKRRVLADPMAQRVLATMRTGLRKHIQSSQQTPELQTLVPELKIFRSVGRLLCAEMDVLFADGKTAQGIDCLNDGLNFGRSVQVGTLISGVVGLYIENITLRTFSHHLNQLTIRDCDKLIRVANHHLKQPDPQIALVTSERDMYLRSFRKYRTDAGGLLDKLDPGPNASVSDHNNYANVCRLVRANPDSGATIFDQATELVGSHFDQTLTEIKRPVWERKYPGPTERNSPAAKLIYSICPPSYSRMGDRFASEQVLLQILGVHAAVLHYWRQHHHLPNNVEELKLGKLVIDPFTGKSLSYKRFGDQAYEISSIGAYDPGNSKHPPTGQLVPITVSYPSQRQL